MTKDEALKLALKALRFARDDGYENEVSQEAITAIKQALAADVQPVAMRMPKIGDKVVCIEDESLGTVVYLTAGGSPEIKFDDGSHGTYMLREFAELFGYTTPPAQEFVCSTGLCHYKATSEKRECMNCAAFGECNPNNDAGRCGYEPPAAQRQWVGLTDEERGQIINANFGTGLWSMAKDIEAKLKEKNT